MNRLARIASLAVVPMVAAACFSGSATTAPATQAPNPTGTAGQSQTASQPASQQPTTAPLTGTVTIWEAYGASGNAEITAFKAMIDAVKKDNPGLTVNTLDVSFNDLFTKFENAASTGGGPDLYIAPNDSLPKEARANLLLDVSSLKDTLKAAPYNESDVALNAGTVDGKLYEIPESMKAVALFYRTDQLPTAPVTTDDWMTNAKKLGLVYGANGGGAYYTWGLYGSFGGKILDDTTGKCAATANTGVADSLKWMADFKKAGGHLYKNDTDAKADFLKGTIAGFIDGPWQTGDLKKALADKLAVAPGPKGSQGAFQPMAAPDGFYINAASKNADLAKGFALAMLTHEQMFVDQAGHIPANTQISISDPITKGFATAIATGFARPTAKELDNYWTPFGNAIASVIEKGTDPTKAVSDACTAMDKANKK